jgi:hypothetical protein
MEQFIFYICGAYLWIAVLYVMFSGFGLEPEKNRKRRP